MKKTLCAVLLGMFSLAFSLQAAPRVVTVLIGSKEPVKMIEDGGASGLVPLKVNGAYKGLRVHFSPETTEWQKVKITFAPSADGKVKINVGNSKNATAEIKSFQVDGAEQLSEPATVPGMKIPRIKINGEKDKQIVVTVEFRKIEK